MTIERPPQHIIDYFYKLSDYNPDIRLKAASKLIQDEETTKYKDYVLDRLIKGLSSGKSGARLGFSTALCVLLHENSSLLSAEEFLSLVEEKLPLTVSKKERAPNALGQHLAFLSAYNSGVFSDSLSLIINKHIVVLDEAPFMRLAFADSVSQLIANSNSKDAAKKLLPPNELMKLLKLVETIERSEKNTDYYGRFSKELVSSLDDEHYLKFAKNAFTQEQWSYNRLVASLLCRSAEVKTKIFQLMIDLPEKNAQLSSVACSMIERFFRVLWRKGQMKDVVLWPENEQILLTLFEKEKASKKAKDLNRPLENISIVFRLMAKISIDEEEIEQFDELAKESLSLAKKVDSQKLLELCLDLLSRKHRLFRTLVMYITASSHALFDEEDVQGAIKSIQNPDGVEMDDGDFKPITDEERRLIQEKWAVEEMDENGDNAAEQKSDAELDDAEDSVSEMEIEDEEEGVEVDPKLKANVKHALGKMAVDDEDEDQSDDEVVEMNEEEMEELDKSLGAAFKAILETKKQRHVKDNKSVLWLKDLLRFKGVGTEA